MALYDKILVAVDGSKASLNALSESIKLSYWVRGSVCAVYVAPSYEGDLSLTGVKSLEAILSEPCKIALSKIRETVEQIDASIQALCLEGEPSEKIIEYAQKEDFDLIVTGIEKKNGLCRAFVKGVTEKIIRYGLKDVLIIPQNVSIGWDKILVAINDMQYKKVAANKAIEIVKEYGQEVLILSASETKTKDDDINKEEIANKINTISDKTMTKTITKNGSISKAILETAFENNTDLIIMSSSLNKRFRDLFLKNTIEKVVLSSTCPVLVVSDDLV